MAKLQAKLGVTRPTQRGERLEEFFQTRKFHRKLGERISDWSVRFEEALARLEEVDVKLVDIPDVCGWFYLSRAGLTPERRERVIAGLPDDTFQVTKIKPLVVRYFADLHLTERHRTDVKVPKPHPAGRF